MRLRTSAILAAASALAACGGAGGSPASSSSGLNLCDEYCGDHFMGVYQVTDATVAATPFSSPESLCEVAFTTAVNCACAFPGTTADCRNCRKSTSSSLVLAEGASSRPSGDASPSAGASAEALGAARSAQTGAVCSEQCTEDASAHLVATPATAQFLDFGFHVCENTPFPSYPAFTHTASVTLRNAHPSRTIAASFVLVRTSNDPRSPPAPCQGAACETVLGRCFAFLRPGESSPPFVYDCETVSNSTPVTDGTNVCVSGPVRESIKAIAMASFCTADSANRGSYCDGPASASRRLQETESAPAPFLPVTVTGCPAR